MLCTRCGSTLSEPGYCSICGTDVKIYKKLIRLSNTYYNMGLEKAKVRDLSGAVQNLRYSLRLNKYHVHARNLLGLIYFETGEVVSALTEWIISKNLVPDKNHADEYLQAIQTNAGQLETINQTIKKYNQSLLYCRQGSEDLAIIQLKKVLSLNPKLVKAHQLLALLYMQAEEYERAERELRRALAIDKTDIQSLRYQRELEERTGKQLHKNSSAEKKEHKGLQNPDVISYTSGNETIIMPTGYKESNGMNVVLNIIIGLVVGIALMWFLVIPAKVRSVRNETNDQVREYSDQISAKQAEINSLQKRLKGLQSEEAQGLSDDYERLIEAYAAFRAGDVETAAAVLEEVERETLSEAAGLLYDEVYRTIHAEEVQILFEAGSAAYSAGNYIEAIEKLEQVVEADEAYENGYALYYLARAYESRQEREKAVAMFQRFTEHFPATERAVYANNAIARLQQ